MARNAALHLGRLGITLPLVAAGVVGALGFLALTAGGRQVRTEIAFTPLIAPLVSMSGFGLDEIRVSGHGYTADSDIYDAVDLDNVRHFFALDTRAVRDRVERLPWIATAELTRVFPGRLDIRVTERRPFAVWRRGGEEMLIDRTGRMLSRVRAGTVDGLPRVAGEGANQQVSALMTLLGRFPALASRLESAEWVGERRWTLHLAGGVKMHLPTDRAAPALEDLAARYPLEDLLSRRGRIIDLRASGRLAIREWDNKEAGARAAAPGT